MKNFDWLGGILIILACCCFYAGITRLERSDEYKRRSIAGAVKEIRADELLRKKMVQLELARRDSIWRHVNGKSVQKKCKVDTFGFYGAKR
jgi:hypothetical protein